MDFFKDNTIEKRVMGVVKGMIATAQKQYEDGIKSLDEKFDDEVAILEERLDIDKTNLADSLVNNIVGKFTN